MSNRIKGKLALSYKIDCADFTFAQQQGKIIHPAGPTDPQGIYNVSLYGVACNLGASQTKSEASINIHSSPFQLGNEATTFGTNATVLDSQQQPGSKQVLVKATGSPGGATFALPVGNVLIENAVIAKYYW